MCRLKSRRRMSPRPWPGIRALGLVGVNVTVPLKERVLPFLDVVDDEAARIGSVNTIHNRDGRLYGYSTDGAGFLRSLEEAGQPTQGGKCLLLGAGGSARAVAFALASRGSHCRIANRTEERAVALAADVNRWYPGSASVAGWGAEAGAFDLLVNTTSLGMHPNEDALPALPPDAFAARPFVYDLIYAPPQTKLLALAAAGRLRDAERGQDAGLAGRAVAGALDGLAAGRNAGFGHGTGGLGAVCDMMAKSAKGTPCADFAFMI